MAVDVAPRTVSEILARTLDGTRLTDEDAVTLLRSRDLVTVGTAADEMRARKTNPAMTPYERAQWLLMLHAYLIGQRAQAPEAFADHEFLTSFGFERHSFHR